MTTIYVMQEFIDEGVRGECFSCPIALAVNTHLARGVWSRVTNGFVDIISAGHYKCLSLPRTADEFRVHFDQQGMGIPFTFELNIPTWALKGNHD